MSWIELTRPERVHNRACPVGTKADVPYRQAMQLVAKGSAQWIERPAPGRRNLIADVPVRADVLEEQSIPKNTRNKEADRVDIKEDTPGRDNFPSLKLFTQLPLERQKALIRKAGLEDEVDLRSSKHMAIAYGAYLSETGKATLDGDEDGDE